VLSEGEQAVLVHRILRGPDPERGEPSSWTLPDLCHFIEERFGKTMCPQSMSRVLRRLGLSKQKARPVHPKRDAKAAEAFVNVWPAPSASGSGSAGLSSLHKRIRPSGSAVGQDGDPRVPVLIKGSASSAILRERFPEHRSTVRPSSSHRSQTSEGRRRLRRPGSVQAGIAAAS
jgi:hypothetical protein